MISEEVEDECPFCSSKGRLPCGGCGDIFYCSREHQRLHWPEHAYECRSYKIQESPSAGRYLTASRNIKAGKMILSDEPMVVGPLSVSDFTCLGCMNAIKDEECYRCPDCSWPMCSRECTLRIEHEHECFFLAKDEKMCGVPRDKGSTPRYDIIMLLRCLLLRIKNPKHWDLIMTMESHSNEKRLREDPYHIAATKYISKVCQIDVNMEDIHHVRGAIAANALEVRGQGGNQIRALYPVFRNLNHSCLPNVHLATFSDFKLEVRAAVDINKGEELNITYTGTTLLRWERQAILSDVHYFTCSCRRCSDPTELGSYFSSPRCPECPNQFMLPQVLWDQNVWACRKCKTKCTTAELIQEIEDWLFRMEMDELFGSATPHKITVALSQIEKVFHDKHFLFLKAAQLGLEKLNRNSSWASISLRKDIWERILKIYDVLEPGLTRRRGLTFAELGKVCARLAEEAAKDENASKHLVQRNRLEAQDYFLEAFEILKYEPKETPEGRLTLSLQRVAYEPLSIWAKENEES